MSGLAASAPDTAGGDESSFDQAALFPDIAFKLYRYIQEERLIVDAAARAGRPVLRIE